MATLVLFGGFFVLLAIRVPVAFALGLACLPVLIFEPRLSPMVLFNEMFKSYNSFILLAVPFFLLTANLMNVGGITDRLMRLSRALVGHFPGGLAQINVLLSVFFAGISGSSTADAASQGKLFIEASINNFPWLAASAVEEPEIPAKNTESSTLIWASPPGKCPTKARDKRINRSVMPPTFIKLAVNKKKGTANKINEL